MKRHPALAKPEVSGPVVVVKEGHKMSADEEEAAEMSREHVERLNLSSVELKSSKEQEAAAAAASPGNFKGGPSNW